MAPYNNAMQTDVMSRPLLPQESRHFATPLIATLDGH